VGHTSAGFAMGCAGVAQADRDDTVLLGCALKLANDLVLFFFYFLNII
jgi:hypothetical protein